MAECLGEDGGDLVRGRYREVATDESGGLEMFAECRNVGMAKRLEVLREKRGWIVHEHWLRGEDDFYIGVRRGKKTVKQNAPGGKDARRIPRLRSHKNCQAQQSLG